MAVLVAYLRCSTDRQEDSLDTQENVIRMECEKRGHRLVAIYRDEGISASVPIERRPAGAELFSLVREKHRGFDGIIVVRGDRLFRDPEDELGGLGYLAQHECQCISVTDPIDRGTPTGELLHGIMMFVRRFERRLTGQRIREHNLMLAMRGKWACGRVPLGLSYDLETKVMSANERAADVERVFREFLNQSGNACATARALNQARVVTRDGYPWSDSSVLVTVKLPMYRRRTRYSGQEFDAQETIPQIVDPELIAHVDVLLARIGPLRTRQRAGGYAYSSLMVCGRCGAKMIRCGASEGGQWICRARKTFGFCDMASVAEKYLDAAIGEAVRRVAERFEAEIAAATGEPDKPKLDSARSRQLLEGRRVRVVEAFVDGVFSASERDTRLAEIAEQVAALESPAARPTPVDVAALIASTPDDWPNAPHDERRRLLIALGAEIRVYAERGKELAIELSTAMLDEPIRVTTNHRLRICVVRPPIPR